MSLRAKGGIDFQTKFGKTPYAVAQVAKKLGIPVFALAGQVGDGIDSLYEAGFTGFLAYCQASAACRKL